MKKLKEFKLIILILVGVVLGILLGPKMGPRGIVIADTFKYEIGQIINFTVPLIIFGFIAPAITKMKANADKMLGCMIGLAYSSSVGAAFFSMAMGYLILPKMHLVSEINENKIEIGKMIFKLDIPPVFSVMTALVLAIFVGLAVVWSKSEKLEGILDEVNNVILAIVTKIIIPILPIFIFSSMAVLSYKGEIRDQLPNFAKIVGLVLIGHFIWLTFLYTVGGIVSGKNPFRVLKHYGPAYMTAVGTMSSAATLPVALSCARKSDALDSEITNFAIPLGATVHLCGSVLTEVFFLMAVNKVLYGSLPNLGTMILFILLLGIFAVGAPGVPGGTVMASLGLIIAVLHFDEAGTALMLTIFALQDSFGTACNVVGDGALALILNGIFRRKKEGI